MPTLEEYLRMLMERASPGNGGQLQNYGTRTPTDPFTGGVLPGPPGSLFGPPVQMPAGFPGRTVQGIQPMQGPYQQNQGHLPDGFPGVPRTAPLPPSPGYPGSQPYDMYRQPQRTDDPGAITSAAAQAFGGAGNWQGPSQGQRTVQPQLSPDIAAIQGAQSGAFRDPGGDWRAPQGNPLYGGSGTSPTAPGTAARIDRGNEANAVRRNANINSNQDVARRQRIEQSQNPGGPGWRYQENPGMTMGASAPGGVGRSSVLENSSIDFAGINAYNSASPQQQAMLRAQGLAPTYNGVQAGAPSSGWNSAGFGGMFNAPPAPRDPSFNLGVAQVGAGPLSGIRGAQQNPFGSQGVPGQQQPQIPGMSQLSQLLGQSMGGGGGGDGVLNRRNSLINRGNQAAAAQASQVRQRALAGGESAGRAERRVAENRSMTEQGRRDSIAQNDLGYQQLDLQRLGISADLASRLGAAFAGGGFGGF